MNPIFTSYNISKNSEKKQADGVGVQYAATNVQEACKKSTEIFFDNWSHSFGIDDSLIEIKLSPTTNSRGIFAKEGLKKGDCFLTIPSKRFISKKNILEEFQANSLLNESCTALFNDERDALIIYFMHLRYKTPESPYYKLLPKSIGVFDEWDTDSVEYQFLLHSVSPLEQQSLMERATYIKFKFNGIKHQLEKLFHPHLVSFDDYLWARIQVTSRAMEFPKDNSLVVVPIIDFANHSYRDQNAFWELTKDGKGMGLFLLKDCPKDSEIFISYEKKDQFQMLCIYGFCVADNPCEYLQLSPNMEVLFNQGISSDMTELAVEKLMSRKGELLEQLRGPESFLIHRPSKNELTPNFGCYNPTMGIFSDTYLAIMYVCILDSIPAGISFETKNPENIKDFLLYCQSRPDNDILCMWIYNIMIEEISDYISVLSESRPPGYSSPTAQSSRLDNIDILRNFNRTSLEKILHVLEDLMKEYSSRPTVILYIKENAS